jgi:ATP-binding protein involved in chromosome partitioning
VDPRLAAVRRQLRDVRRIVAVTGGKGGIGKSLVASTLALTLSVRGVRTGLLDLDLTGACDHLILGTERITPHEEHGVEPPLVHGVRFMSVSHFVGDAPAPLRGTDVTNAMIELLAISRWGELDVLVVDMPPGLGDATLDAIRLFERAEYLVVANRSKVVIETVRRMLRLLAQTRSRVTGVVENMRRLESEDVQNLARDSEVPFLGSLPYDASVEDGVGRVDRLLETAFAEAVRANLKLD